MQVLDSATAISIIEIVRLSTLWGWKNSGRVSQDWKAKLYEQASAGLQLAIYNRITAVIRLESPVSGITGVTELNTCPY